MIFLQGFNPKALHLFQFSFRIKNLSARERRAQLHTAVWTHDQNLSQFCHTEVLSMRIECQ